MHRLESQKSHKNSAVFLTLTPFKKKANISHYGVMFNFQVLNKFLQEEKMSKNKYIFARILKILS